MRNDDSVGLMYSRPPATVLTQSTISPGRVGLWIEELDQRRVGEDRAASLHHLHRWDDVRLRLATFVGLGRGFPVCNHHGADVRPIAPGREVERDCLAWS
jgi:hypothetical protein